MNDETKLVKEAKNDKASRCWSAYQKKIRQNGIRRNGITQNAIRQNATQPSTVYTVRTDNWPHHPLQKILGVNIDANI